MRYPNFEEYVTAMQDTGYSWYTICPRWAGVFIYLYKKVTKQEVRVIWYRF